MLTPPLLRFFIVLFGPHSHIPKLFFSTPRTYSNLDTDSTLLHNVSPILERIVLPTCRLTGRH